MLEDLVAFLVVEMALEAHERRLLARERRWRLRADMVMRIALAIAALAFAGAPFPR
jgi:hypothetical protein